MKWLQGAFWPTLAGFLGSILATSCASRTRGDEERAIRELDAAWSEALLRKDLDAVMSYYAEEAAFLPPGSPILRGRESIRARFAARMSLPGYSASFAPTEIAVARSRDIAYELGLYRLTLDDGTGRLATTTGKHLVVWKKEAGGKWKVAAESINSDEPARPAAGDAPGGNRP